jgi:hypothetical protein
MPLISLKKYRKSSLKKWKIDKGAGGFESDKIQLLQRFNQPQITTHRQFVDFPR